MLSVLKSYVESNLPIVKFILFIGKDEYDFEKFAKYTGKELLAYLEQQQNYEIVQLVLGWMFDNQVYIRVH